MKKPLILISIISTLLCGCATNYAQKPAAEISKAITIKDSEFDSQITYIGPQSFSETKRGLFVDNETVQLLATKNKKSGEVSYFIYVRVLYSFDWRFYNSASLANGTQLNIKPLSKIVNSCAGMGCIHTEEVSIPIDRKILDSGADFKFRLNSKSGAENIITINKSYIEGFFTYLELNLVI